MKTKKLFLLAAMLLMSVCSFAQNNNTPLKGDVNEDGKVDVADIAAVINIMKNGGGTTDGNLYFYVGTEKPTSLSQATVVDSYPAEYTFTNPSTTEKCYVYVLTNADKTVNFYDPADPDDALLKAEDVTTINGFKITYISADGSTPFKIAKGGSVKIRITEAPVYYYYYIGWTLPTASNVDTIITETYPTSRSDATQHAAGKKTTSKSSFSLASINLYYSVAKTNYYVLVPTGHAIYDTVFGQQLGSDSFTSEGTITVGNQIHTIYKSVETSRNIASIEIK